MNEKPFIKKKSLLSDLDPRIRIIYTFLFSIVVALLNSLPAVGFALAVSVILFFTYQISIRFLLRRLFAVNIFVMILWLLIPFTFPGRRAFVFAGLTATYEGILYTLILTIKCNAIIIMVITLLSTCRIFDLVHAFNHLRIPDKLIYLFFLLYRYTYVIQSEYEKLKRTLKIRGFRPKTSLHTYKTYGYIIGTLLLRSYERSEQVHRAMVCRGFKGKYWLLEHFRMVRKDIIIALIMGLSIIILLLLQWLKINCS